MVTETLVASALGAQSRAKERSMLIGSSVSSSYFGRAVASMRQTEVLASVIFS